MKFGKVNNVDEIDFTLPEEPQDNQEIIQNPVTTTSLYIGATGWSMPDWKGVIYPNKTKSSDFLKAYGKQFNAIEFNTTHYRIPTAEMVLKWRSEIPGDFKFCPKIPQHISHRKNFGIGSGYIEKFCESIFNFKENLGPCFLQLPPYVTIEKLDELSRCLEIFPPEIEMAIEVRNASFFDTYSKNHFFARMQSHNAITVITDVAGRRDLIHSRLTTNKAFIRWVGNDLHASDYTRLQEWKNRIDIWRKYGIAEIYFFPHEPDNLHTPQISSYFYDLFQGEDNLDSRAPKLLLKNNQLKLF